MKMRIAVPLLLLILCTACGQPAITPAAMPTATPRPTPSHATYTSSTTPTPTPTPTPSPAPTEALENVYTEPTIIAPIEDVLSYDFPANRGHPNGSDEQTRTKPKGIKLSPNDKDVFVPEDMVAGNLRFGMSQESAFEIMGKPDEAYVSSNESIAVMEMYWYYANGNILRFSDEEEIGVYALDYASIDTLLPGPRGIIIGDTLEKVMRSFRVDPDSAHGYDEYGIVPLYALARTAPIYEDLPDDLLAPSGILKYDSYSWWEDDEHEYLTLHYDYPYKPYTVEEIASGERAYIYIYHYFCNFTFVDRKLSTYRWSCGPQAY